MKLTLTADQASQIEPHLRPGWTLLGKIGREQFTGTNPQTSGALVLELGRVPEAALPALREAIRKATGQAQGAGVNRPPPTGEIREPE